MDVLSMLFYKQPGVPMGGGGILPLTIDFSTLPDGALPSPLVGATWSIISGVAVNIPTLANPLNSNGDFSAWVAGVPTGWTVSAPGVADITEVASNEGHGGVGTGACNLWQADANLAQISQAAILSVNNLTRLDVAVGVANAGQIRVRESGAAVQLIITTTGNKVAVGFPAGTAFQALSIANPTDITIDNLYARPVVLTAQFAYLPPTVADVTIRAGWTITAGTPAGLMTHIDSVTAPLNYLIAYHDGTNAHLDQVVAGVRSSLINTAAVYAAGADVELRKSGNTAQLWYNDTQVGVNQTVNAAVTNNLIHTLWSGYGGNTCSFFTVVAL